jgi:hypothetical protein
MPLEILGIIGAGLLVIGTGLCAWANAIKRRHNREKERWHFRMRYGK